MVAATLSATMKETPHAISYLNYMMVLPVTILPAIRTTLMDGCRTAARSLWPLLLIAHAALALEGMEHSVSPRGHAR